MPCAGKLWKPVADRLSSNRALADHRSSSDVDKLEHMGRTRQDGDADRRMLKDTGEPQSVRFFDGSHLRAQHCAWTRAISSRAENGLTR